MRRARNGDVEGADHFQKQVGIKEEELNILL